METYECWSSWWEFPNGGSVCQVVAQCTKGAVQEKHSKNWVDSGLLHVARWRLRMTAESQSFSEGQKWNGACRSMRLFEDAQN